MLLKKVYGEADVNGYINLKKYKNGWIGSIKKLNWELGTLCSKREVQKLSLIFL